MPKLVTWMLLLPLIRGLKQVLIRSAADAAQLEVTVLGALVRAESVGAAEELAKEFESKGDTKGAEEIRAAIATFRSEAPAPALDVGETPALPAWEEPLPAILPMPAPATGEAPKRKRGRPRKHPAPDTASGGTSDASS